jgi:hypothetical protein
MSGLEVSMLRFRLLAALVLLAGCSSSLGSPPNGLVPSTIRSSPLASSSHCPQYAKGSGLLSDGDFHQAKNPGAYYLTFSKGQSLAPFWKVTKLNINFVGTMFWNFDGLCSVDLDGQSAVGGVAYHSFATKKGAFYTVSFLMSGNSYCAATVKKMKAVAGNKSVLFKWDTAGGHSVQYGVVARRHFEFIAAASTTGLVFDSLDQAGSGCGPVIGAVAVTKN